MLEFIRYIRCTALYFMVERKRCLWMADDFRCSNCKARRIRLDVLKIKDYEVCDPEKDYGECEFYLEKPVPPAE